jgi:hypothetical protein
MPSWGNTDSGNNKPTFPELREVLPVAVLTTNGAVTSGNTITFTSNASFGSIAVGMYVYGVANSFVGDVAVSRLVFDLSGVNQNDVGFLKSNNTITSIDTANSKINIANPVFATLASGSLVYVANTIPSTNVQYPNRGADVILVTASRLANGLISGANSAINTGWNRFTFKVNNDGTKRYLKETLVALANPVAFNVSSGNTTSNSYYSGL